jgi:hypothetical protein
MAAINGAIRDLQGMPPLALTDVRIAQVMATGRQIPRRAERYS